MRRFLTQQLKRYRQTLRYLNGWRQAVPVTEYSGTLLDSGIPLRLLTLGSSQLITEALFRQAPEKREIAQLSALQAPGYLHSLQQSQTRSYDLILQPHLPWHGLNADDLLLPDYLEARIPFRGSYHDWLASLRDNTRRSVQQAQKLGISFRRASTVEDYAYFHQHLLTPYMQARHGYNCYVETLAEFCADTRHACLELLIWDGQIVAGFHLKLPAHANASYFNKVGLSPASFSDKTRMRLLNSLIYARMAELSINAGFKAMELGITPAILGHGILWYKAGWGAEFRANDSLQTYRLSFVSDQARQIQAQLPPLICIDGHAQLHAQSWSDQESKQSRLKALEKYRFAGLGQIQITLIPG